MNPFTNQDTKQDTKQFRAREFHAHLYYGPHNLPEAKSLTTKIRTDLGLTPGTMHQQPIGPHPVWSCAVHFPVENFATVVQWLMANRGSLDVLVHPDTGDDMIDHSALVVWLGRSYDLKMDAFTTMSKEIRF